MGRFTTALQNFSFPDADEQRLLSLRQQFVEKFPMSRIPELSLNEYALGVEPKENSFCWWMEFNTDALARIRGAPSSKHIVYYSQKKQEWWFDKRYRTKEDAFTAVRQGLVKLLELAANDEFQNLDGVSPFENQNLTRGKILYLYYPEKFLPICSLGHLKDFCVQFGIAADFESQASMNAALVALKHSDPEVSGWSNLRFAKLLYDKFTPKNHFWKIAPGENAAFWPECRDGKFICVGWGELGDMSSYKDEEAFKERYKQIFGPQRIRQWKEIWSFAKEIGEGDTIIANNGLKEIVGIGTCAGEYFYDTSRADYKHCLPVRWEVVAAFDVPEAARPITASWFQGTVKQLSREEFNQIAAGAKPNRPLWRRSADFDLILTNPSALDVVEAKSLYTQVLAAEFGGISQHVREELREWLDNTGSVLPSEAYVTLSNWFLSSPIYTQTERAKLAAKLWDLLFAERPVRLSSTDRNTKVIPAAFEAWWAKMKAAGAAVDGVVSAAPPPPQPTLVDGRYAQVCLETFMPEQFFKNCERLLDSKKQIILQGAPGTGKTFIGEKVAALWAGNTSRVKVVQFHESFGYEDFVFGIKPRVGADGKTAFCPEPGLFLRFCEEVRKDTSEKFVLLIDEINRAKTSRVFGELLYLLEYRDREVELQNGTKFSIPPNLYIVGTMNTTDKSIALVDYALRRRFAFIDLAPVKNGASLVLRKWLDANGIANGAEVDTLFIALNAAIAQKDEGLMVGHSYFMQKAAVSSKRFSDEMLRFLWDYYILPLVAEYEYQLSRPQLEERYGLDALRSANTKAPTA